MKNMGKPEVKSKKMPLDLTYYWKSSNKYTFYGNFGNMLNLNNLGLQGAILYCIKQVNSGRAMAGPETIVTSNPSQTQHIHPH